MQIAFCLTKYFPCGGWQRDVLCKATICPQRGHPVRVLTMRRKGEQTARQKPA